MLKAKITSVGSSLCIVLSKEVLSKLHAQKGDDLYLIETNEGYEIVSYDPEFEKQMAVALKLRHKNKDALRLLAKK